LKGFEIAAVHADDVGATLQRALQLVFIVDFAQRIELQSRGKIQQPPKSLIVERRQDQQNGVGMVGAGFCDLKLVDDEVLAQAGKLSGGGSFKQVGQLALKKILVGEDGERRGPTAGQLVRQRCHRECPADYAL